MLCSPVQGLAFCQPLGQKKALSQRSVVVLLDISRGPGGNMRDFLALLIPMIQKAVCTYATTFTNNKKSNLKGNSIKEN